MLASADLAHVGRRFGDDIEIDAGIVEAIGPARPRRPRTRHRGRRAADFYSAVMRDGNERRVCGLNAIYATLVCSGARNGELLGYGSAPDPAGGVVLLRQRRALPLRLRTQHTS